MRLLHYALLQIGYCHDDLSSIGQLVLRSDIAQYLSVGYDVIYHGFTMYSVGFVIGIVAANIFSRVFGSRNLIIFAAFGIVISNLTIVFNQNLLVFFVMRLLDGACISMIYICLTEMMKRSLSDQGFNKFLKDHAVVGCVIDSAVPIIFSFCDLYVIKFIFISLSLMAVLYMFYLKPIDDTQVNENKISVNKSILVNSSIYAQIVKSNLVFLLAVIGIVVALPEIFSVYMEEVIDHKDIFSYVFSFISIMSIVVIEIFTQIIDTRFSNQYMKPMFFISLIGLIALLIACFIKNIVVLTLMSGLLFGCMYSIEYLCAKFLYSKVENQSCVAGSILLSGAVFVVIAYMVGVIFGGRVNSLILCTALLLLMFFSIRGKYTKIPAI